MLFLSNLCKDLFRRSPSSHGEQARRRARPAVEALEDRTVPSTSPVLALTGPDEVLRVDPTEPDGAEREYVLNLTTDLPVGTTITQWNIDWGDGSDPDNNGSPGEVIFGNPSLVLHAYTTVGQFDISATATLSDGVTTTTIAAKAGGVGGLVSSFDTVSPATHTGILAHDSDGDSVEELYMGDHSNNQVLVNRNGSWETLLDASNFVGAGPRGLTLSPDGTSLLISGGDDSGSNVLRYDFSTGTVSVFVSSAAAGSGAALDFPTGLIFGPDLNSDGAADLLVASNDSSAVFAFDGLTGEQIGSDPIIWDDPATTGDESNGLQAPIGLTIGPNGRLYVSDLLSDVIYRYDFATDTFEVFAQNSNATPILSDGRTLSEPRHLTFGPDGDLYVPNYSSPNILRFDGETGAMLETVVLPGQDGLSAPVGVTFTAAGNFLVSHENGALEFNGPFSTATAEHLTVRVLGQETYASTDVPRDLKDAKGNNLGITTSTLTISDDYEIRDLDVSIEVTHSRLSDLDVFLIAPDGTRVQLFANLAGNASDGITFRVSDEDVPVDIGVTKLLDERMRQFEGKSSTGTWTLELQDDTKNASGRLESWSLIVTGLQPPPPAGITVTPTSGLTTNEAGGAATFNVVLASQPTTDVTLTLSSSDTSEGILQGADTNGILTLTFTSSNWSTPQTVTVIGVDDADQDGDIAYTIITSAATSSDSAYDGLDPADVSLTNADDEGPSGSANDLYVWDITHETRSRGKNRDLRILVTVRRDSDADGSASGSDALVSGANVTLQLSGPDGGTFSGTTDSSGVFRTDWIRSVADGGYTAEVTGLSHAVYAWNQALDPTGNDTDTDADNLPEQHFSLGSALRAGSAGDGTNASKLSMAQVRTLLAEATSRLADAGYDVSALDGIQIRIAELEGTTLGLAAGDTIFLDRDAAGWGWFVDPTPWEDGEFSTPGDQGEQGRVDLLSVLMHEMGHVLGHDHEEAGVMQETLSPGERHTPAADDMWSAGWYSVMLADLAD